MQALVQDYQVSQSQHCHSPVRSAVNHQLLSLAVENWFKFSLVNKRDLTKFHVYENKDTLVPGAFFVTGHYDEMCVAEYRLMQMEYALQQPVKVEDCYRPALEHGTYELLWSDYEGFPRELWRCKVCGWVTPSSGYEDVLNCGGCGEVLMPAEED
jgi:hypothetical protein